MNGENTPPDSNARRRGQPIGTTPVPNALFDEVMPTLSDTQLRVLLVVARSTLGWRDGTGHKERDWLSHRQLQSRTGRAGAAVSGAIDALVRRGLLEVQDSAGQWRATTSARRAARGPLFYRLGETFTSQNATTSQSEVVASTNVGMSKAPYSVSRYSIPEVPSLESGSTSERRLHQAKTTKEIQTKEIQTKEIQTKEIQTKEKTSSTEIRFDLSSLGSEVLRIGEQQIAQLQGSFQETPARPETNVAAAEKSVDDKSEVETEAILSEDAEAFVRRFRFAYAEARPNQACPPIEAEEISLLERYLETYGSPLLERWLPAFFASDFGYVRRRSWSLGSYLNSLFILQAKKGQSTFGQGSQRT